MNKKIKTLKIIFSSISVGLIFAMFSVIALLFKTGHFVFEFSIWLGFISSASAIFRDVIDDLFK